MIANKLTLSIFKSNVIVINSNTKNNSLTTDVITSKLSLVQKENTSEFCLTIVFHLKIILLF